MQKNLVAPISMLLLLAFALPAQAMSESQTDHLVACVAWCGVHNKTDSSYNQCYRQCWGYWTGHRGIAGGV